MKLIDKDSLVAEIEKRIERCAKQREDMLNVQCHTLADDASARMGELRCFQDFIDTLEVKEVGLDFKQELYKAFGQVKDFTLGMQIAKWFYEMGRNHQEPVSEGLEEAATKYAQDKYMSVQTSQAFKAGANWQKEKDESTTEDLGEYINELSKQFPEVSFAKLSRIAVRVAKWQKTNLWKPADGEDLPEIDREVIVLVKYSTQRNIHDEEYPTYRVGFGHRPDPKGWEGKSVTTGKVEHYTPKTYDKGGWNIPDVKYWLDVELPKEIEL